MSFLKNFTNWIVRKKKIEKLSLSLFFLFLFVSFLPVFYVLIKRFFKIDTVLDLKETLDFDWLSYYGSLIVSYFIIFTLYFENKRYREEKRDSVRPIFNIGTNYDSMGRSEELKYAIAYAIYSENRNEKHDSATKKKWSLYQCNHIRVLQVVNKTIITDQNENVSTRQNSPKSILIMVRNIGSGHALIEKIKYKAKKGFDGEHILKPDERFMIDKGTSNNLLLQFDSKISDIDHVKIYFIDILGYEYVYKLKLECKPNRYPKHYIKLKNTKVYLANLSKAYFESYFPKLVGKAKETDY